MEIWGSKSHPQINISLTFSRPSGCFSSADILELKSGAHRGCILDSSNQSFNRSFDTSESLLAPCKCVFAPPWLVFWERDQLSFIITSIMNRLTVLNAFSTNWMSFMKDPGIGLFIMTFFMIPVDHNNCLCILQRVLTERGMILMKKQCSTWTAYLIS